MTGRIRTIHVPAGHECPEPGPEPGSFTVCPVDQRGLMRQEDGSVVEVGYWASAAEDVESTASCDCDKRN